MPNQKYFQNSDPLSIKQKPSDSWLWKGWLSTQDIVKEGLKWIVQDGQSINIWEDRWIPGVKGDKPRSCKPDNCMIMKVHQLFDDNTSWWNKELVDHLFYPDEAQQILQIPVDPNGDKDHFVWGGESHGHFTVKSAYQAVQQVRESKNEQAESNHGRGAARKMWREVWKLPVKPKLRHFIWKCLHNWLSTSCNLKKRGVQCDEICIRCGMEVESREHIFFRCSEAQLIWKLAPLKWDQQLQQAENFEMWWRAITDVGNVHKGKEGVQFSVYLLWHIWKARNLWYFQKQKIEPSEVVQKAMQEWMEFEEANMKRELTSGKKDERVNIPDFSKQGRAQNVIIHVASESIEDGNATGVGCLLLGEGNKKWLAKAEKIEGSMYPGEAELLAIFEALNLAVSMGLKTVEIRLDVKTMVAWLQEKTPSVSEARPIVENILSMKKQLDGCRFVFIHRHWNCGSHNLAKFALSSDQPQSWVDCFPQWVDNGFAV